MWIKRKKICDYFFNKIFFLIFNFYKSVNNCSCCGCSRLTIFNYVIILSVIIFAVFFCLPNMSIKKISFWNFRIWLGLMIRKIVLVLFVLGWHQMHQMFKGWVFLSQVLFVEPDINPRSLNVMHNFSLLFSLMKVFAKNWGILKQSGANHIFLNRQK